MNAQEFFHAVCELRRCQKNYFATRSQRDLRSAKWMEDKIDAEIARVQNILQRQNGI